MSSTGHAYFITSIILSYIEAYACNCSDSLSPINSWSELVVYYKSKKVFLVVSCRLEDANSDLSFKSDMAGRTKFGFNIEGMTTGGRPNNPSKSIKLGVKRGSEGLMTFGRTLKSGVTRAVFPEDLKVSDRKIFDPQDKSLLFWNRLLVISCIFAVSVDPLFLFLPVFKSEGMCLHIDESLAKVVISMRTILDLFYVIRMVLQFRTAYIAPSSRVFGRGELVIDPKQIASRYIQRYFVVDLLSVLPLPQVPTIPLTILMCTFSIQLPFGSTVFYLELSLSDMHITYFTSCTQHYTNDTSFFYAPFVPAIDNQKQKVRGAHMPIAYFSTSSHNRQII